MADRSMDDFSAHSHLLEESVTSYNGSANLFSNFFIGEEEIKSKLQWFFKTPYEKYNERGRKPFKLILQIIKIILITLQATLFAVDESSIVRFSDDNLETFQNLFIFDYNAENFKKLYTKKDVYNHMFYAWKQYYKFEDIMMGSYAVIKHNNSLQPIYFCKEWYYELHNVYKQSEDLQRSIIKDGDTICYYLKPPKHLNETTLEDFISMNNLPRAIGIILKMKMNFSFHTNYSILNSNLPDCYKFDIQLVFDNNDLDGIMALSLEKSVTFHACHSNNHLNKRRKGYMAAISLIVVIICIISTTLCIRSFKAHYQLCRDAENFFEECRYEKLKFSDKLVFISYWLVLIVLADVFSVFGSIIKLLIDWGNYSQLYWICSIFFGLAVLFSWSGILRYLGYLQGYNVLLVTLKVSFPSIMRFIGCVLFIYVGFVICGWIVLGPYHEKFASLMITCECLYSLLNGDDMFNTFMMVHNATPLILYFSKIYLYIFISLFIFVALSLFIGIVEESFEKVNESGSAPRTRVELFMEGREYENADDNDGDND